MGEAARTSSAREQDQEPALPFHMVLLSCLNHVGYRGADGKVSKRVVFAASSPPDLVWQAASQMKLMDKQA